VTFNFFRKPNQALSSSNIYDASGGADMFSSEPRALSTRADVRGTLFRISAELATMCQRRDGYDEIDGGDGNGHPSAGSRQW